MSIYKRGEIYWVYFSVNGLVVRKSTGQKTLKAAKDVESEMVQAIQKNKAATAAIRFSSAMAPSEWAGKVKHELSKAGNGEIGLLCRRARSRAKDKGREFLLDPEALSLVFMHCDGKCAVTGMPLSFHGESHSKPSIDRIDSSKGYTMDNVRITSVIANMAMNQWGERALRIMCGYFAQKLFSEVPN